MGAHLPLCLHARRKRTAEAIKSGGEHANPHNPLKQEWSCQQAGTLAMQKLETEGNIILDLQKKVTNTNELVSLQGVGVGSTVAHRKGSVSSARTGSTHTPWNGDVP